MLPREMTYSCERCDTCGDPAAGVLLDPRGRVRAASCRSHRGAMHSRIGLGPDLFVIEVVPEVVTDAA